MYVNVVHGEEAYMVELPVYVAKRNGENITRTEQGHEAYLNLEFLSTKLPLFDHATYHNFQTVGQLATYLDQLQPVTNDATFSGSSSEIFIHNLTTDQKQIIQQSLAQLGNPDLPVASIKRIVQSIAEYKNLPQQTIHMVDQ